MADMLSFQVVERVTSDFDFENFIFMDSDTQLYASQVQLSV